ncbi:MAG TPA: peptide-methionine (S)-S-oxide reductase MsrA [Longimicrobiaceae bacterium]|nr:peptide-methionine (S)-S-oxide reductase MsrA [Longimicrobiaceae bacterium]
MKLHVSFLAVLSMFVTASAAACQAPPAEADAPSAAAAAPASAQQGLKTATFAGGCFWCVEEAFDAAEGVVSTTSGYMGGHVRNPTYKQVSAGGTGHAEVVQVVYDPRKIGYAELLNVFWRNVDPVTPNRQFCDVGSQYRSAIFAHDAEQRRLADASKAALDRSGKLSGPVVTEVVPAAKFYPAEEYHQDYYRKNPIRYKYYKFSCGRARRLEEVWGKQ